VIAYEAVLAMLQAAPSQVDRTVQEISMTWIPDHGACSVTCSGFDVEVRRTHRNKPLLSVPLRFPSSPSSESRVKLYPPPKASARITPPRDLGPLVSSPSPLGPLVGLGRIPGSLAGCRWDDSAHR
jgi:hypothetical protein